MIYIRIDLFVWGWIINNGRPVLCNLFPNGVTQYKLSNNRVSSNMVWLHHSLAPWCASCLKAPMQYGRPRSTLTAFHGCALLLMDVRLSQLPFRFLAVLCVAGLDVSKFWLLGFLCLLQDLVQFHLTYGWREWKCWKVKLKGGSHQVKVFQCWPWFCWWGV